MNLKEVIELIDPQNQGIAWLNFMYRKDGIIISKANSRSSFLVPLYEKKIEMLVAADKNLFNIYIEEEENED